MEGNPVHEFRILRKLGEGAYADVYMVRSVKDQQIYAEKRLKKRYRSFDEVNQLIEVISLRTLSKHPNIIHLHSVMYDSQSGHVALIFEVAEMNLLEFLSQQTSPLDEQTVLLLIYQLLKGIAYVHSHGLFHRDIKPENCLINIQTHELKIADFGSAGSVAGRTKFTEYVATRWYRAPECILTSGTYGPPVDVWAIGCVLFEMLTSRPLFPGKHQLDQLNQIHSVLGTPSRDLLAHFQMGPENSKVGFAFPQREKQSFRNLVPNATDLVVNLMEK
jgi:renal tumor antigen